MESANKIKFWFLGKILKINISLAICDSWNIKKAKCQRIDAFVGEDLRVPWTARRSNQSILEEISPE